LALLPLVTLRSFATSTDSDSEDEGDADDARIHYHVIDVSTGKSFGSRNELLNSSRDLFGKSIGLVGLTKIIANNQLLHGPKGSFLITVSGLNTWFDRERDAKLDLR
jgi:hypothetical protein